LVRNWGRIDTSGQELVEIFDSEIEAGQAVVGPSESLTAQD
jgi:predicted DNA-binding WGR domain protein